MLLKHDDQGLCLIVANAILQEIYRQYSPIAKGILGDISRDISEYLLALWKEGGYHHAPRYAEIFATEVCLSHGGLHGDRLTAAPVPAEGKRRQCPVILWIAVNNSSSTSDQMGMKMVPKRPPSHC